MPTVVELSALAEGLVALGENTENATGWSVANAGDVNGDGFDDIIVGSRSSPTYVIFGGPDGIGTIDLANLQPSGGFRITGTFGDYAGFDVSSAGDVNGDGFDDLVVGGFYYGWYYGILPRAYVIYGKDEPFGTINVSELESDQGFKLYEVFSIDDFTGLSVSAAGDVNGDGLDDLIVGSPHRQGDDGAAFVLFGRANNESLTLQAITLPIGFTINGGLNSDDFVGASVAGAGDVNGDGFDDLIVGAPRGDTGGIDSGQAYVIFGKASGFGTINLTSLAASAGFMIQGDAAGDNAGFSVSSAGDVNGDGYDDVIVGAPYGNNGAADAGEAYVIFGKASGFGTVDLTNLAAGAGFIIQGDDTGDHAGWSVAAAGDVNGDGYDDIVVGAPGNDNLRSGAPGLNDAGEVYVILGHAGGFGTIDLSTLASTAGFVVQGISADDQAGRSVGGGGDVNGDGRADIVIGAPFADPNHQNAGAAYVILDLPQFGSISLASPNFGLFGSAGGWGSDIFYPREVADVNGDDRADIIGFGENEVFVSLANPDGGFAAPVVASVQFGRSTGAGGWTSDDIYPRSLADVNGDGTADIVAFGEGAVFVAIANASGTFANAQVATGLFARSTASGGWISDDRYPRELADINGDGRADIVGFGQNEVYVALGNANGTFAPPSVATTHFTSSATGGGWASDDRFPRMLADLNGDGRADIVGFGQNGVYVALANMNGTFANTFLASTEFGAAASAGGWASMDRFPRQLADVNDDGKIDIIGFGANGVFVALGIGDGTFERSTFELRQFGSSSAAGGFTSESAFPRRVADLDQDGAADIIGFGSAGVFVGVSNGDLLF